MARHFFSSVRPDGDHVGLLPGDDDLEGADVGDPPKTSYTSSMWSSGKV